MNIMHTILIVVAIIILVVLRAGAPRRLRPPRRCQPWCRRPRQIIYIYIYRERERYMHMCIYIYIYKYILCIYIYIYIYMYVCVYIYIYIYIYTYIYLYICRYQTLHTFTCYTIIISCNMQGTRPFCLARALPAEITGHDTQNGSSTFHHGHQRIGILNFSN